MRGASPVKRRALILCVAPAIVAAWLPPSAAAQGGMTSPVATVMRQLDRLDARRSAALERELAAQTRLAGLERQVSLLARQVVLDRQGLRAARASLAQLVVSSYKSSAQTASDYVFDAGSVLELANRVDTLDHAGSSESSLVGAIDAATRRLHEREAALAHAAAQARRAAALAAADARRLTLVRERRARYLATLTATQEREVQHETRRRVRLAQSSGGPSPAPQSVFYGEASWYGPGFEGQPTASGEIFHTSELTCASPWLPFGTRLSVTDLDTGLSVEVRVNDRGPYGGGILDLTHAAAEMIGLAVSGRAQVRVAVLN